MACDPTVAFAGELNGKPICCATAAKYGKSFVFGGCHIVSKKCRGKGYGKKIYDAVAESVKHFRSEGSNFQPAAGGNEQTLWISQSVLWSILHF